MTYTISVYNPDTKAKTNVTVKDTNNFVGSINATNTDKYTYNGDNTWTIPEIGAGETIDITYTYTVQSNDEKLLENKADVTYSENGDTVKLDTPTVDVVVPDKGTVSIHKEADKKMAKPGEVVTYNVTVTNNKGFDVHDVVVTDANNFAGEITGVDGADYTFENGEFHIAEIAAGASVTLTYTYTVEIGDVPTQILENIATADVPGTNPEDPNNPGHGKDPNKPIDNDEKIPSNPVDVEVPGSETETKIPDLVLTKSVDKSEAAVGDTLNYTITVKNNGKGDAENVTVKDFFDGNHVLVYDYLNSLQRGGKTDAVVNAIIDKATKQHEMQEAQSILKEELQNTIAEEIRSCIPQIVDAVTSSIQKNGIAVAAPASNHSPQNITDTQTINTTPKTEEAPPPISEEAMLALQLADMFGG